MFYARTSLHNMQRPAGRCLFVGILFFFAALTATYVQANAESTNGDFIIKNPQALASLLLEYQFIKGHM